MTETIGSEGTARLLEREGSPHLAAIYRLTPAQARNALAWLAGYNRKLFDEIMERTTGGGL